MMKNTNRFSIPRFFDIWIEQGLHSQVKQRLKTINSQENMGLFLDEVPFNVASSAIVNDLLGKDSFTLRI